MRFDIAEASSSTSTSAADDLHKPKRPAESRLNRNYINMLQLNIRNIVIAQYRSNVWKSQDFYNNSNDFFAIFLLLLLLLALLLLLLQLLLFICSFNRSFIRWLCFYAFFCCCHTPITTHNNSNLKIKIRLILKSVDNCQVSGSEQKIERPEWQWVQGASTNPSIFVIKRISCAKVQLLPKHEFCSIFFTL